MKILTLTFFENQKINTKPAFLQGYHQLELSSSLPFRWSIDIPVCHSPHYSLMFVPHLLHSPYLLGPMNI